MFTIIISYLDDSVDQFSNVDFFKFDSSFVSFLDYSIPIEDIYKVTVYCHNVVICHWFNE